MTAGKTSDRLIASCLGNGVRWMLYANGDMCYVEEWAEDPYHSSSLDLVGTVVVPLAEIDRVLSTFLAAWRTESAV